MRYMNIHTAALTLFSMVLLSGVAAAASPQNATPISPKKPVQAESSLSDSVTAELTITGPVKIDPQAAKQLKAYQEYLAAIEPWEREACKIAGELYEKEKADGGVFHSRPLQFSPSNLDHHSFTDEVIARMPPRPKRVSPPAATEIPMVVKITNTGNHPVPFNTAVYCDMCSIEFLIEGEGAYKHRYGPRATTMEIRRGTPITIAPGESTEIKLSGTHYGSRMLGGHWALTKPGRYKVSAEISCNPQWGSERIEIKTNVATLKAVVGK